MAPFFKKWRYHAIQFCAICILDTETGKNGGHIEILCDSRYIPEG